MDARHALINQYLVNASFFKTGVLGEVEVSPDHSENQQDSHSRIDDIIEKNNRIAGKNKLSEDYTYRQQWIKQGPPLSVAQLSTLQKKDAYRRLQDCIIFYNETYRKFFQNQVLHPTDYTTEKLDDLFKKINLKRFTVEQPEDTNGIRVIRRDRQLICIDSSDERECCDSQIGPGISISSWPPNQPFLHFAATLGSAEIVSHLIKHYGCWVDVQQKEEKGTALHLAAYYGHLNVVNAILQANPDITLKNSIKQKNKRERIRETALESAKEGKRKYKDLSDLSKMDFLPIIRRETGQKGQFSSEWKGEWDAIITKLSNYKQRPEGMNP
jgi:hypothetical protein